MHSEKTQKITINGLKTFDKKFWTLSSWDEYYLASDTGADKLTKNNGSTKNLIEWSTSHYANEIWLCFQFYVVKKSDGC